MKKLFFVIGLIISLNSSIFGHTGYPDKVICPVCRDTVVFNLTMSMTTFGGYTDFQKKGAIGYYYEEMINSCNKCYYSGYHSDFDTVFSTSYIDSINHLTLKFKGKEIDNVLECEIAAEIKMLTKYKYDKIADIYLIASYLLRTDSLQVERRKRLQIKTVEFLLKALENNEYEKNVIATINYLIGEMYRRTGYFSKAIFYYDLAINDNEKEDWLKDVAVQQKKLAINEDENNNI